MKLELQPFAEGRGDLDAYCNVAWASFQDAIMGLIYPNGYTEAARQWAKDRLLETLEKHPDQNKLMKVVDHDLPDDDPNRKIAGIAWWKIYPTARTPAQIAADEQEEADQGLPADSNEALLHEFHANHHGFMKQTIGGDPFVLLALLSVLPEYQRKGVGSMHLRWGAELADRLGLQSYLEASPMGRPLYERMGYNLVCEFPFDARKWGRDEDLPHVCMLRPAKTVH